MITSIAIFAALALALQFSPIKIPAPYAPFLFYELWEIPMVAAFLLFGARVGVFVAVINFLGLIFYFRGTLDAGPIYNLIATLAMLLGMLLGYRAVRSNGNGQFLLVMILGISARVAVMTFVNALLLPMPPPLGFSAPLAGIEQFYKLPSGTLLSFIALFNFTLALYTIPLARVTATAVSSRTRTPIKYGR